MLSACSFGAETRDLDRGTFGYFLFIYLLFIKGCKKGDKMAADGHRDRVVFLCLCFFLSCGSVVWFGYLIL